MGVLWELLMKKIIEKIYWYNEFLRFEKESVVLLCVLFLEERDEIIESLNKYCIKKYLFYFLIWWHI